jgi:subtilisin family serine protease
MKNYLWILIVLPLLAPPAVDAATRNVAELGVRALKNGRIASIKPARDFTRIRPGAKYASDRLLVRFAPAANLTAPAAATKNAILVALGGGTIQRNYDLVPGLTLVKLPAGQTVNEAMLIKFNSRADILYASPDYIEQAVATTPNDTYWSYQWPLYNAGDYDIDATDAWDYVTGNDEIVVAVIDTGVSHNHPDLAGNMWVNSSGQHGYDYYNNDSDPSDDYGHGSHCAGIIGAVGNNSTGIAGVCWDIRIMALKFLDSTGNGPASNSLSAIEYAVTNGAHVLSCSWRYYSNPAGLEDAIDACAEANVIVVAAAGNESYNLETTPCYPAAYDCDNLITVVATTTSDGLSSYSNYGQYSADLGAPGDSVYSCLISGYGTNSGTSMATPHVAGVCTLLLSVNPSLSYSRIKDIIMDDTDYKAGLATACVSGPAGSPDLRRLLRAGLGLQRLRRRGRLVRPLGQPGSDRRLHREFRLLRKRLRVQAPQFRRHGNRFSERRHRRHGYCRPVL